MNSEEAESLFQVLHAGPFVGIGDIVAILTGQKIATGRIFTEWYYLVESGTSAKAYGCGIDSEYFKTIKEFWEAETKQNLTSHIYYDRIVPALEAVHNYSINIDIKLREVDSSYLVNYSKRPRFLTFIDVHSRCASFKKFIGSLNTIGISRNPYEEVDC